jgi:hypothetical protein
MKVGKAHFEFLGEAVPFEGKPMNAHEGSTSEQLGSVAKFRVTTTDQLDYVFGIVQWPDADPEVIFVDAVDGDSKYERLQRAGRMGILTKFGDFWLIELTAMKINPDKGWANLAGASFDHLKVFLGGDAGELLMNRGALGVGTRESLVGDQSRNRNVLALTCEAGNLEVIATAFVVTRVLAIMNDYGQQS